VPLRADIVLVLGTVQVDIQAEVAVGGNLAEPGSQAAVHLLMGPMHTAAQQTDSLG